MCSRTKHCSYRRERRCCASLPETESRAAPSTAAALCNDRWNFYYHRPAKNGGRKSETESVVNLQLKSQSWINQPSSIALRTEARVKRVFSGSPSGAMGIKYFRRVNHTESDDAASVIDFCSSGNDSWMCTSYQRTLHQIHIFSVIVPKTDFENEKWTRTHDKGRKCGNAASPSSRPHLSFYSSSSSISCIMKHCGTGQECSSSLRLIDYRPGSAQEFHF